MPASFTDLTGLTTLDLSGNTITSIPDISGLPVLSAPNVSDNLLGFGSLDNGNYQITGIVYSPQKTFFTEVDVLAEVNTELVINREEPTGSANIYTWYKDNVVVPGETGPTLTLVSAQFTDEGIYRSEVTSSIVPVLIINTANYLLKVSSLERDRIALTNIYNATGGPDWTDNTDWLGADVSTWFGVTVANNRVTVLSLPANNLLGDMPTDLRDIGQITEISLEDNELRALPDVTRLTQLTTLSVAGNRLGFGDLVPNSSIPNFTFDPQRRFGVTLNQTVQVGENFTVSIDISGDNNTYEWYRKERRKPEDDLGTAIPNSNTPDYLIENINFDNMGIYYVNVTNEALPGLTIRNRNQNVFAVTDIFGTVFLNQQAGVVMDDGDVLIYEILAPGQPFELIGTSVLSVPGTYSFDDVFLGDYIVIGRPGPTYIEDVLQTYYVSINDWVLADPLQLRDVVQGIDINMLTEPEPFDPTLGDGTVLGLVESDFPDFVDPEAGLRTDARRRVRRAGCSLLRSRAKNRVLQDTLILGAYTETDNNGEFTFGDIPPGNYFLNIQIPGVPMDTTNLIEFVIDESIEDQVFNVEALALPDAIRLQLIEETGFYRKYFKNLVVYPNPARDYVTITYEKLNSASLEIRLIDLSGQAIETVEIDEGRFKQIELDISQLRHGIYILNIIDTDEANQSVANYRLIIND